MKSFMGILLLTLATNSIALATVPAGGLRCKAILASGAKELDTLMSNRRVAYYSIDGRGFSFDRNSGVFTLVSQRNLAKFCTGFDGGAVNVVCDPANGQIRVIYGRENANGGRALLEVMDRSLGLNHSLVLSCREF